MKKKTQQKDDKQLNNFGKNTVLKKIISILANQNLVIFPFVLWLSIIFKKDEIER